MIDTAPRLASFYRLVALDEADSTNAEAQRRAASGAPAGTLIWARRQTAGRGRRGRAWQSPPGNLAFSLLLRPAVAPAAAATLGFVAGLALVDAIDGLLPAGRSSRLKWPNDVLVDGRKLAGILLESEGARADRLDALILGLGVNLASHPPESEFPATDLRSACGVDLAPDALLADFAARLEAWMQRLAADGFAPLRAAWRARAHGLGRPIRVRLPRETLTGIFADLDAAGFLLLDAPGGRRLVSAGDVFFDSLV